MKSRSSPDYNLLIWISHWLLFGLVLVVAILHNCSFAIVDKWLNSSTVFDNYKDWAKLVTDTQKPAELLSYIIPAGILLFYYLIGLFVIKHRDRMHYRLYYRFENININKQIIINFFMMAGVCLFLSWQIGKSFDPGLVIILWTILFLYPVLKSSTFNLVINSVGIFLLSLVLIALWTTFTPYIGSHQLPISNDYLDIDESTKIGDHWVNNADFLNKMHLYGSYTYKLHSSDVSFILKPNKDYISLTKTAWLTRYIEKNHIRYRYDNKYHGLFVTDLFTLTDRDELCDVVGDSKACDHIQEYYKFNIKRIARIYTPEEVEFLQKNQDEMMSQAYLGRFFHHHNALLGSINALALGKSRVETVMQYGWLTTLFLAKCLQAAGGVTLSNYIKITYFFYPLYYSLLIAAAFILFRNIWLTIFVSIVSLCSLWNISFETIRIAPGFNPIRHFFDLFVLVAFYFYLNSKNKYRVLYLLATMIFIILSFLTNEQFGIFILFGMIFAFLVKNIESAKVDIFELISVFLTIIAVMCLSYYIKTGADPSAAYYFYGVGIPSISNNSIDIMLGGFSIILLTALLAPWPARHWKYLSIYLFVYGITSLIYYVWNSSPTHLFSILSPWILLLGIFIYNITKYTALAQSRTIIYALLVASLSMVSIGTAGAYFADQEYYNKQIGYHKIYQWDFPAAKFSSTMNPEYFVSAVSLINKYTENKGVYLISKYDNILPFLANRYNNMPFMQLDASLVTQKEVMIAAAAIINDHPRYLFVDSDIGRNRMLDVYKINHLSMTPADLRNLSLERALAQENLDLLFSMLRSRYHLIERSQLISVYQLNKLNTNN